VISECLWDNLNVVRQHIPELFRGLLVQLGDDSNSTSLKFQLKSHFKQSLLKKNKSKKKKKKKSKKKKKIKKAIKQ